MILPSLKALTTYVNAKKLAFKEYILLQLRGELDKGNGVFCLYIFRCYRHYCSIWLPVVPLFL